MDMKRNELTEMRLQTAHQEHIARQSENVTLMLTLIVRLFQPKMPKETSTLLEKLLIDFRTEGMQWRERIELLTVDDDSG